MREGQADFLIIGSTTQARLLAGLLASVHGKSVVLQGARPSSYRLAHALDISLAPMTRPESWALLSACIPETVRLVTRIAKRAALSRVNPMLFADQPHGLQALGHVRHMAAAHGVAAERTPALYLGAEREGVVLRDAVLLRRPILDPALDDWLNRNGVTVLAPDIAVSIAANGSAVCMVDGAAMAIGQTILADDEAILSQLRMPDWPAILVPQGCSTILTEPTRPLAAPVMIDLDGGIMLHQQSEDGVLGSGPGEIDALSASLGVLLGAQHAVRHAGQSAHTRLLTRDGGPAVGRANGTGADVLANFGPTGAFLMPALARWLCGAGSDGENEWFGARLINRDGAGQPVNEIGAAS